MASDAAMCSDSGRDSSEKGVGGYGGADSHLVPSQMTHPQVTYCGHIRALDNRIGVPSWRSDRRLGEPCRNVSSSVGMEYTQRA